MSGQVRRYVLGTYLNSAGVEGGGEREGRGCGRLTDLSRAEGACVRQNGGDMDRGSCGRRPLCLPRPPRNELGTLRRA